jgi:transcriptional regulator with XRE-family HTH domain
MMFMDDLENYGFILKCLREHSGLSVRAMAGKIGRSTGWLSEVENGKGLARLPAREFERIVNQVDGAKHRAMFRTWVANHKNAQRVDRTFDGAVLKYIRKKKGLKLEDAAKSSGLSAARLSKLERGVRPLTPELRKRLMLGYGYNPSSFKNLATDPVRSASVPLAYKLEILLGRMAPEQIENVFKYAREMSVHS